MKRCGKCGARNQDEEKACTLCGTFFSAAKAEDYEPRLMQRGGKAATHRSDAVLNKGEEVKPTGPPREDLRAERHYLVLTFGEPVKLDPKQASYVLGRDLDVQVRLPSLKSSRRHAEVRWKDGKVLIRDLGSRNGTWVDGSRIDKQAVLEDGQMVRLGDSILTYRFLVPGEALRVDEGPSETLIEEPLVPAPAAPLPVRGLEGELVFLSLSDLMKKLATLRASGTIVVRAGAGGEGRIELKQGVAAVSSYAALEGPVALQAIVSLTRGTFKWEPDPSWRPPAQTMAFKAPPLA
jgi:hypothetical protein